ncbi:hypothetical protein N431DRAFT_425501 [Stipitochalara longipes BDJ]|nr:hypothetical protein N431DRAFT_425501 [Stipitochalara longipes BDJ]
MSTYAWRTVSAYRLSQSALDNFLLGIFGPMKFYIELKNDDWAFWADRDLTDGEKEKLDEKRVG